MKLLKIQKEDILDTQGGLIPFGYPKKFVFNRVALIGDSACMVKATTGGGIIMILNAAKILTLAIKKSIKANDFSESVLEKNYEVPAKRTVGYNLKIHYFIRMVLSRFKREDFNMFFNLYSKTRLESDFATSMDRIM